MLKPDGEKLLRHEEYVRHAIANFDGLMVDILQRGATLIIAILAGSWALFMRNATSVDVLTKPDHVVVLWLLFAIACASVLASIYIWFGVWLYSALLHHAVQLSKKIEQTIFACPREHGLSTSLDRNVNLAAGRWGPFFYRLFAFALYIVTVAVATVYLSLLQTWCIGLLFAVAVTVVFAGFAVLNWVTDEQRGASKPVAQAEAAKS